MVLRAAARSGVQADTEGRVSPLEDAARAYAAANRLYTEAYKRWRLARPDETRLQDHFNLDSWKAEVQPACRAANDARNALTDVAERLFG